MVFSVEQGCGLFQGPAFGFDNIPENEDKLEQKPSTVHQSIPSLDVSKYTSNGSGQRTSIQSLSRRLGSRILPSHVVSLGVFPS